MYLNDAFDISSQVTARNCSIKQQSLGAHHLSGNTTAAGIVFTAIVRTGDHRYAKRTGIVAELQFAFGQMSQRADASLCIILQSIGTVLLNDLAIEADKESIARSWIWHIIHSQFGAEFQESRIVCVRDGHSPYEDNEWNY